MPRERAPIANDQPDPAEPAVLDVPLADIEQLLTDDSVTEPPSSATTLPIPINDGSGFVSTASESDSTSQISSPSDGPSRSSKTRWRKPTSVRGFASQANAVATKVLNGEIDLDTARTYSSVARTVAQSMSIEVSRSRFLRELPDLTFDGSWEEENG